MVGQTEGTRPFFGVILERSASQKVGMGGGDRVLSLMEPRRKLVRGLAISASPAGRFVVWHNYTRIPACRRLTDQLAGRQRARKDTHEAARAAVSDRIKRE